MECVLASDSNKHAKNAYLANFPSHETVFADNVKTILETDISDFDILCAGFPCQAFSQIGAREGFKDEDRGNLFFDIARILEAKRPKAFFLENVRYIVKHDNGNTFNEIHRIINDLGYSFDFRIIKAYEFGLPQNRPRAYMVGFDKKQMDVESFSFPDGSDRKKNSLESALGVDWCEREIGYTLRVSGRASKYGDRHNWDSYKVSKDGEIQIIRLNSTQGKRMMGFPEDWIVGPSETQAMKQLGNSVAVPVIEDIAYNIISTIIDGSQ